MKRYWFYGTMPSDTISEKNLSDEHKKIIDKENNKINNENYKNLWLGYRKNDGWDFMRHGFEVIHINEERGNIARDILYDIIKDKYYQE